jgi:cytochrome d ubiquinol oxidase subunit I
MRAELVDFWTAVLNPSTIDRLVHVWLGAFLMGAFFVLSISAYYLLKEKHLEFARRSFSGALLFATVFSCLQLVSGHSNARMVAAQQPAKMAAAEGHFKTGPADLHLIGIPDPEERVTRFSIAIPGLLSFLIANDSEREVIGLDKIPREDWPPVVITFASYHVMVAIGFFFIALTLLASFYRLRGTLFEKRWLLKVFVGSVVLAIGANEFGWATAEVGRQPWTVYPPIERTASGAFQLDASGMLKVRAEEGLRTLHSVSESLKGPEVLGSILMFSFIYLLLFILWIYVLDMKIKKGPVPVGKWPEHTTEEGFLSTIASRTEHAASLTEAKDIKSPT